MIFQVKILTNCQGTKDEYQVKLILYQIDGKAMDEIELLIKSRTMLMNDIIAV